MAIFETLKFLFLILNSISDFLTASSLLAVLMCLSIVNCFNLVSVFYLSPSLEME